MGTGNCHEVSLRRLPFPYRAMLAICSDLDETPDRQVYGEILRFLNTTEDTCMGLSRLTVCVPDSATARLRVNGVEVGDLLRRGPDHTGRASISVPWRRLEFPLFKTH